MLFDKQWQEHFPFFFASFEDSVLPPLFFAGSWMEMLWAVLPHEPLTPQL